MTQKDILQTILKDSNYNLSLVTDEEIEALRQKVFTRSQSIVDPDFKTEATQ